MTGLSTVTGELTGSRDSAFADREPRAPAIPEAMNVNRPGASFHEESARPQVPDRRREGFHDRHARPMISTPRVPPRPYVPRTRYRFEMDGPICTLYPEVAQLIGATPRIRAGAMAAGPRDECATPAPRIGEVGRTKLPPYDTAESPRVSIYDCCRRVESVFCVWPDRPPVDELCEVLAGMRSGPTPRQSMSRVQRSRVVSRGLPAPPVFCHVVLHAPRAEQGWHQLLFPMWPPDATLVPARAPSRTGPCHHTCGTESGSS